MGRRLFVALFGGRNPGLWRVGDDKGYDRGIIESAILTAYLEAISSLGGEIASATESYQITRSEWVMRLRYAAPQLVAAPGNQFESDARRAPNELVNLEGRRQVAIPPVSSNTFINTADSLAHAIATILAVAQPGDKLAELVLLDHGIVDARGQFVSQSFGADMLTPLTTALNGAHGQQLVRLRPLVDADTVITLAGCSVASNATGRNLLLNVARLLGVQTQGFVEDQLVMQPGIEGLTMHCNPRGCARDNRPTAFAARIYGTRSAEYGNIHPGWE